MIYIDDNTPNKLPQEHHNNHNVSVILYDQIMEIFANERYAEFTTFSFNIDHKKDFKVKELEEDKINSLDWLKLNNRHEELNLVLSRHIFMSVLTDFCHFIYESLSCAMRGKVSVAYSLLRKPLTDELLIFEQLLIDNADFVKRFFHEGTPEFYDPSSKNLDKRKIIKAAIGKLNNKLIYNEDMIYDLRFDKTKASGLNSITNQAIHIVTTDKNYKTENKGLNFVFSIHDDGMRRFWDHYYAFVPILILYSTAIIDQLVDKLITIDKSHMRLKSFKRFIGMMLLTDTLDGNPHSKGLLEIFKKHFSFPCHNCNTQFEMELADLDLFFHTDNLLCPECCAILSDGELFRNKLNEFALV